MRKLMNIQIFIISTILTQSSEQNKNHGQQMNRLQILQSGYYQSCAYLSFLVCWGSNLFGESSFPASLATDYLLYLSIGRHYACSLTNPSAHSKSRSLEESGRLMCWGNNDHHQLMIPSKMGKFNVEMVRAGDYHTCAKGKVELVCWGKNDQGQTDLVEHRVDVFAFSVRKNSTCVVSERFLVCFGEFKYDFRYGEQFDMSFVFIALGQDNLCHTENTLICAGDNEQGQNDYPDSAAAVVAVSSYGFHTCAVQQYGHDSMSTVCWGLNDQGQTDVVSSSNYAYSSVGEKHSCFAKGRFKITCIGTEEQKLNQIPSIVSNQVHIIKAGGYFTCQIKAGVLNCIGKNEDRLNSNIPDRYLEETEEMSLGQSHICNSRTMVGVSTTLSCWGLKDKDLHQIQPPNDQMVSNNLASIYIESGFKFSCVSLIQITDPSAKSAICWGLNDFGQTSVPAAFLSSNPVVVTTGIAHACGLTTDRRLFCWGRSSHGQDTVPECMRKSVALVESGSQHNCAISTLNQGECWGYNAKGQTDIPKALGMLIVKIAAGGDFSCALQQSDQRIICWGGVSKTGKVPSGFSKDIIRMSLGQDHICVKNKRNIVKCWGGDEQGQNQVEDGEK